MIGRTPARIIEYLRSHPGGASVDGIAYELRMSPLACLRILELLELAGAVTYLGEADELPNELPDVQARDGVRR